MHLSALVPTAYALGLFVSTVSSAPLEDGLLTRATACAPIAVRVLKDDIKEPVAFCKFWLDGSDYNLSPIIDLTIRDVTRACKCITSSAKAAKKTTSKKTTTTTKASIKTTVHTTTTLLSSAKTSSAITKTAPVTKSTSGTSQSSQSSKISISSAPAASSKAVSKVSTSYLLINSSIPATASTAVHYPTHAPNSKLVKNGDFANGSDSSWSSVIEGGPSQVAFNVIQMKTTDGSPPYAGTISMSSGVGATYQKFRYGGFAQQDFTIYKGEEYYLAYDVYLNYPSGLPEGVTCYVEVDATNQDKISYAEYTSDSPSMVSFNSTGTTSYNGTGNFFVIANCFTSGTSYLNDFTIGFTNIQFIANYEPSSLGSSASTAAATSTGFSPMSTTTDDGSAATSSFYPTTSTATTTASATFVTVSPSSTTNMYLRVDNVPFGNTTQYLTLAGDDFGIVETYDDLSTYNITSEGYLTTLVPKTANQNPGQIYYTFQGAPTELLMGVYNDSIARVKTGGYYLTTFAVAAGNGSVAGTRAWLNPDGTYREQPTPLVFQVCKWSYGAYYSAVYNNYEPNILAETTLGTNCTQVAISAFNLELASSGGVGV
ncbi:hypothetical protein MBLNU459_g6024t1 [Dothideomycetes sp. NU459]